METEVLRVEVPGVTLPLVAKPLKSSGSQLTVLPSACIPSASCFLVRKEQKPTRMNFTRIGGLPKDGEGTLESQAQDSELVLPLDSIGVLNRDQKPTRPFLFFLPS